MPKCRDSSHIIFVTSKLSPRISLECDQSSQSSIHTSCLARPMACSWKHKNIPHDESTMLESTMLWVHHALQARHINKRKNSANSTHQSTHWNMHIHSYLLLPHWNFKLKSLPRGPIGPFFLTRKKGEQTFLVCKSLCLASQIIAKTLPDHHHSLCKTPLITGKMSATQDCSGKPAILLHPKFVARRIPSLQDKLLARTLLEPLSFQKNHDTWGNAHLTMYSLDPCASALLQSQLEPANSRLLFQKLKPRHRVSLNIPP
jgi:hypothetical protein